MCDHRILSELNRRSDIGEITLETIEKYGLSAAQADFLKDYYPQHKLIIYGTLAPGKPNHHIMEGIAGEWFPAILKGGKLESRGWGAEIGFNGFVPAAENEQQDIFCYVLFSNVLSEKWGFLDVFEGEGYRRILAPYLMENGQQGVAYVYAVNQ